MRKTAGKTSFGGTEMGRQPSVALALLVPPAPLSRSRRLERLTVAARCERPEKLAGQRDRMMRRGAAAAKGLGGNP